MKGFGYHRRDDGSPDIELREVTFVGTPDEIRRIAHFLEWAADEMARYGEKFGHRHLRDKWRKWNETHVDVIVDTPLPSESDSTNNAKGQGKTRRMNKSSATKVTRKAASGKKPAGA